MDAGKPCKNRKIKCGEEKPACLNCQRVGEQCDYHIRLNWEGRARRKDGTSSPWSSEHISLAAPTSQPYGLSKARSLSPGHHHHRSSDSIEPVTSYPVSFSKGGEVLTTTEYPQFKKSPAKIKQDPTADGRNTLQPRTAPTSPYAGSDLPPFDQLLEQFGGSLGNERPNKRRRLSVDTPGEFKESKKFREFKGSGDPREPKESKAQRTTPQYSQIHDFNLNIDTTANSSLFAKFKDTAASNVRPGETVEVEYAKQGNGSPPQPTFNDLRRLSVKSLLLSPPEDDEETTSVQIISEDSHGKIYGYDQGRPDLDVPRNDDINALTVLSPNAAFKSRAEDSLTPANSEFGFGIGSFIKETHFEKGGYYAEPVPIQIPPSLEPIPSTLKKNPMNLLYFHHFLNHTARLLVPLDCPENPFRSVLPQMAIMDINLLHLLLAYAASHRARLLGHSDPVNRIAHLVRDVFPNLRCALANRKAGISNANLATAIMLASLEIISPNAFEIPVRWQDHLTIARQMIVARGGYQSLPRTDKASYFLSRWFAYLDVVGSLSGSYYDRPLAFAQDLNSPGAPDRYAGDDEIDCVLGCTGRCIAILAKIADLAKQCDSQRIGLGGMIHQDWQPSPETFEAAEKLRYALKTFRPADFVGCPHRLPGDNYSTTAADRDDMIALNDAFHWAGLIHLYRRVYGKPSEDAEVQQAVARVVAALDRTRFGGTAEASVIFPMFTAGCEAKEPDQREKILQRIMNVESYGMTQVHRARTLMQKVWTTGRSWETLVTGEFFG